MIQKEKILLILIPGFPSDEEDVNCLPFPQQFIKNLSTMDQSTRITVLAFQYPYRSEPYQWHGIKVIPLNGQNKSRLKRLVTWKKAIAIVSELNKKYHIIGALSFWLGECSLITAFIRRLYGIKSYTWLMGQDAKKKNKYQFITRPKPDQLISLSDALSREYRNNYGIVPGHLIPLSLDVSLFLPTIQDRTIDLIAVGSLIELKRFDIFVEVIEALVISSHKINAVICGEGPLRMKLEKLIREKHLENHIKLLGEIPHPEILNLLNKSRILLHPSDYEGNPTVCAEALFSGAHVISFCKPMDMVPAQHHIVHSTREMINVAEMLLVDHSLRHERFAHSSMDAGCRSMMELFTH